MTYQEQLDLFITERIDSILAKHNEKFDQKLQKEESLLNSLEPEIRKQFESFAVMQEEWTGEECQLIYREAFMDGLRLGCSMVARGRRKKQKAKR